MNNNLIVKLMTNLINKKFYSTKEEAIAKLDVYFAMNKLSEEEYAQLCVLAQSVYEPFVEEFVEENFNDTTIIE